MKKNQEFSIRCNDKQFVAYRETLRALGYNIHEMMEQAK